VDNVIDWVEIPVKDMARAKAFYQKVLGRELFDLKMPGMEYFAFQYEKDKPGAGAALVKSKDFEPDKMGVTVYFFCKDLSVELARVEPSGGKIILPRTVIPESGSIALLIDTEGNRVGLHSTK
jgi:hypothetical protein